MLTQEPLFLTRVLGKKSWPKKGNGRRGILWKIHGNPWKIRENPWNINGKSAEIYGESAEIHWKSLENLWKSIIKQALFGYSLLAMVPTFAACASSGYTFWYDFLMILHECLEKSNECPAYWLGPYRRWSFLAPPTGWDLIEECVWHVFVHPIRPPIQQTTIHPPTNPFKNLKFEPPKNQQFLVLTLVILLQFWALRGPWPLLATKK